MGLSPDTVVGAVLTLCGGVVAAVQKLIVAPIKSDIDANSSELEAVSETADTALDKAEDNEAEIAELTNTQEEILDRTKATQRIGHEQAVVLDDIRRALNESDLDANIPDRDGDFYRNGEQEQRQ